MFRSKEVSIYNCWSCELRLSSDRQLQIGTCFERSVPIEPPLAVGGDGWWGRDRIGDVATESQLSATDVDEITSDPLSQSAMTVSDGLAVERSIDEA